MSFTVDFGFGITLFISPQMIFGIFMPFRSTLRDMLRLLTLSKGIDSIVGVVNTFIVTICHGKNEARRIVHTRQK